MVLKDLLSLVRPFWGPSWARLGPCSGHLGPSWGHLWPSWGHLGAILGVLAAILGQCWAILAPFWGVSGPSCRPRAKTLIFLRFLHVLLDFARFFSPDLRMCARDFQGQARRSRRIRGGLPYILHFCGAWPPHPKTFRTLRTPGTPRSLKTPRTFEPRTSHGNWHACAPSAVADIDR